MEDGQESIRIWIFVSNLQFWLILLFVILSIVVLIVALQHLLSLRKSHYFVFLLAIIVADFVTLATLLFDVIKCSVESTIDGALLCKILVFVSNIAASFVNWTWFMMFLQRCVLIMIPFERPHEGFVGLVRKSGRLILVTLIAAIVTQSWSLFLLTEHEYITDTGFIATTCERDTELLSPEAYKWVAFLEALSTYVAPFLGTIVLDVGVIYWTQRSSMFSVVTSDQVRSPKRNANTLSPYAGLKIQSSQSIKSGANRRKKAMRRCFVMATVQVLLNAPYYIFHLLDEVYGLQASYLVFFVTADAVLYFVYLFQFPMIIIYINSLRNEMLNHGTSRCNSPSHSSSFRRRDNSLSTRPCTPDHHLSSKKLVTTQHVTITR